MNRRWIHNDTPCRIQEDADAGYECEVVDAAAYDQLKRFRESELRTSQDMHDQIGELAYQVMQYLSDTSRKTLDDKQRIVDRLVKLGMCRRCWGMFCDGDCQ